MRNAILVASKSQYFSTTDNVVVRGSGLAVTQFLRGTPAIGINEFIHGLKDFIETVKIDQAVKIDCISLLNDFALDMTLFSKFEEIWEKLAVKDKTISTDLADKLKKITWIIFILGKVRILNRKNDLVDSAYLLAAAIHVVAVHSPNSV